MKRVKTFWWGISVLILGLTLTGCRTLQPPEQTATLRIRAFIDGADSFHIQGDTIRIRHHAYELPGRWRGANEPVYINGDPWFPEWDGNDSSTYVGFGPKPLPREPVDVSLASYATTWGSAAVWQQPREENDYTLIVTVDDRGPEGAHWYTLDLESIASHKMVAKG